MRIHTSYRVLETHPASVLVEKVVREGDPQPAAFHLPVNGMGMALWDASAGDVINVTIDTDPAETLREEQEEREARRRE